MHQLRYTDEADSNLADIALHIANESSNRDVAVNFVKRLRAKCRQLASLPATLGTARPELRSDIRSTPCQGYVIFFRYQGDVLEIVNILHGSRDIVSYFSNT